jgi:hypothetical protein
VLCFDPIDNLLQQRFLVALKKVIGPIHTNLQVLMPGSPVACLGPPLNGISDLYVFARSVSDAAIRKCLPRFMRLLRCARNDRTFLNDRNSRLGA